MESGSLWPKNHKVQQNEEGEIVLILTRRVGETMMIGDDVTVTVLGVKGNQVRIGINAPMHVGVHREEIYERIKREQQHAAKEGEPARPVPGFAPTGAQQAGYSGPSSRYGGE